MIISLGTHCFAAHVLKSLPYRREKSPFDWLFSNPAMVLDCLQNDFARLTSPDEHVAVPMEERPHPPFGASDHPYYRSLGVPMAVFNHHDVVTKPNDFDYIKESAATILALDKSRQKLFFIATVWPAPLSVYRSIFDNLERFGSARLLIVDILPAGICNLDTIISEENFEVIQYTPYSALEGIQFRDERDFENLRSLVLERVPAETPGFGL